MIRWREQGLPKFDFGFWYYFWSSGTGTICEDFMSEKNIYIEKTAIMPTGLQS